MNFIEAVKAFYEGIESGEYVFITRKSWPDLRTYNCCIILGIDQFQNLGRASMHTDKCCYNNTPLLCEDYLADDWAFFDFDRWEIREAGK